ncbi:flagellar biosynthetic protein FliO [uncultured Sphingorhabdus sp.]|uniref:flagellar biosynthetic protein FliO n=1 Tax=uncultured Sphingorhabdus sp. TaxID=1686106 RepID=UPI00260D92CE|nr:flagellar biosynthetic protein FliO [uncultured Sphingorhabdus sp.]HMS19829.1 flagellar biosynthetic protein FliO [Sphingorhabdus sp.]
MLEYLLRLALLLPLVGGLAWASLWMWKRLQTGLPGVAAQDRLVRLVEVLPLGAGNKLAVVEFGGRLHLIALGRGTITPIAIDDRGDFDAA